MEAGVADGGSTGVRYRYPLEHCTNSARAVNDHGHAAVSPVTKPRASMSVKTRLMTDDLTALARMLISNIHSFAVLLHSASYNLRRKQHEFSLPGAVVGPKPRSIC